MLKSKKTRDPPCIAPPLLPRNRSTPNSAYITRTLLPRNRSAQTGETISWVIATLVIVGILILFIYASTLMAKIKVVTFKEVKSDLTEESKVLNGKTNLANIILNNKDKEIIEVILQNDE